MFVTCILNGGLGNQMFQLAFLYTINNYLNRFTDYLNYTGDKNNKNIMKNEKEPIGKVFLQLINVFIKMF